MAAVLLRQHAFKVLSLAGQCQRAALSRVFPSVSVSRLTTLTSPCGHTTSPLEPRLPVASSCHLMQHVRGYAKKGKEKKGSKKGKASGPSLDDNDLTAIVDVPAAREEMEQALHDLQQDMVQRLPLRTSIGTFEQLPVTTEDGTFPLIQIGQIIQKSPQLIIVNMEPAPQYTKNVKEALLHSNLNINPQEDKGSFFIPIPKVTRAHREGLVREAHGLGTKTKARLQKIQNSYIREMNNTTGRFPADLSHNVQQYIQRMQKEFSARVDQLMEAKKKEMLG